jgi:hypothetical protein
MVLDCHRQNKREGFMLVRARCSADIENLYRLYQEALPSMSEPTYNLTRDYRWRLSVSRNDWIRLSAMLAETVNYPNFKRACHDRKDQANKSLAYGRIWQVMADVQRTDGQPAQITDPGESEPSDSDQWEEWIAKLDKQKLPPKRKVGKKKKLAVTLW